MHWVGKYANPNYFIIFRENQNHMIFHILSVNAYVFLVNFRSLMHETKIIKNIINTIYILPYNYDIYIYGNNYDSYYIPDPKVFLTLVYISHINGLQKKESYFGS